MKIILTTALLLGLTAAIAQPYGQTTYPNTATMTAAHKTGLNPGTDGFIMAGLISAANPSLYTIRLEKTTTGGQITSTLNLASWQRDYYVNETVGNCFTLTTPALSIKGVDAIELVNSAPSQSYALVGTYPKGCFLTFLNSVGLALYTKFYPFPSLLTTLSDPPRVLEEPSTGDLFICGEMDSQMYVMRVDNTGAIIWSNYYDVGSNRIEPRSMILSPFTGDLIVAGHMGLPSPPAIPTQASDAFFMALDQTNGGVIHFRDYDFPPCNWFNEIIPSYSDPNGPSYLAVGYADPTISNHGGAWAARLDVNGNVIWTNQITPAIQIPTQIIQSVDIVGVVERLNSASVYEIYCLAQSRDTVPSPWVHDMSIYKLSANGQPWSVANPLDFDEYHFWPNSGIEIFPKALTFVQNGATSDVGLQAFANYNNGWLLQESYFNGITGCPNEQLFKIGSVQQGPQGTVWPVNVTPASITTCTDLIIPAVSFQPLISPVSLCSATTVIGGSNFRSGATTDLEEFGDVSASHAYPNPGNGLCTLDLESTSEVSVYNMLGELLHSGTMEAGKQLLDLREQPNGVYLLKVNNGRQQQSIRLVKE